MPAQYRVEDELFEVSVMVDEKLGMIYFNDTKLHVRYKSGSWYKIPPSAWVTPGKVGFEALHEKLGMLAQVHKFDVKPVIELIANSGIIRKVYFVRDLGLPLYVTMLILKMLREGNACVGSSGILRKTVEYVMFLRQTVDIKETAPSITSNVTKHKYTMPNDLHEMTSIMIQEELRHAEEGGAKETMLNKLRKAFKAKQQEERHKGKKGGRTEFEIIRDDIKKEEGHVTSHPDDGAEYSDVPQKRGKR